MTILLTTHAPSLLPRDRDLESWHRATTAEIATQLSADHAAILARPETTPAGTVWVALPGDVLRLSELSITDRDSLLAAVASIRSDIRRLAQSGRAPAVAAAWPALCSVPDLSHVFVATGRPVLAGWSLPGPAGELGTALDRYDDGIHVDPPVARAWRTYGLTAGVLACLALIAGLFLPLVGLDLATPPAQCTAAPGQLQLMRQGAEAAARGAELRTALASLTAEVGQRQLTCPVPVSVAPPRRADLPQDRWERRDVSMLEGCWNLTTHLSIVGTNGQVDPFASWKMCFGRDGSGQQTETGQSGRECRGPLAGSFVGDVLLITMPANCTGSLHMQPAELRCRRVGDAQAHCAGHNLGTDPIGSPTFDADFQR